MVVDRDSCIGDMVCVSLCPEVFERGEDGRCSIRPEWRVRGDDPSVGVVPEELYECVKAVEEVCPLGIVRVEKLEEEGGGC